MGIPAAILDAALPRIAEEVGKRLALLAPQLQSLLLELSETYEVWSFREGSRESLAQGKPQLRSLIERTGRWHHQIRSDGKVIGFARSVALGNNQSERTVESVTLTSRVADRLEEATGWAEAHVQFDVADASLISASSFYTHAIWLISAQNDQNLFVIADAPPSYKSLRRGQLLTEGSFLHRLRLAWTAEAEGLNTASVAAAADTPSPLSRLRAVFEKATFKFLSKTDSARRGRAGYEIYGTRSIRDLMGGSTRSFPVRLVCLSDSNLSESPFSFIYATWYQAHEDSYKQSSDYRLYLKGTPPTLQDFFQWLSLFVVVRLPDDSVALVLPKLGSRIEGELRALLGVPVVGSVRDYRPSSTSAAYVLNALGVE